MSWASVPSTFDQSRSRLRGTRLSLLHALDPALTSPRRSGPYQEPKNRSTRFRPRSRSTNVTDSPGYPCGPRLHFREPIATVIRPTTAAGLSRARCITAFARRRGKGGVCGGESACGGWGWASSETSIAAAGLDVTAGVRRGSLTVRCGLRAAAAARSGRKCTALDHQPARGHRRCPAPADRPAGRRGGGPCRIERRARSPRPRPRSP